jgi:hypothetical protein
LDLCGSGQGQVLCFCEYGKEHLSFLKCVNTLIQLRNCQLLKKSPAPSSELLLIVALCGLLISSNVSTVGPRFNGLIGGAVSAIVESPLNRMYFTNIYQ